MFINSTKEGGFIDECWEKANWIASYTIVVLIVGLFISLVVLLIAV